MHIGFGGNSAETLQAFSLARESLGRCLGPLRCSSIYRTEPQDDLDQEPFWNAVVEGYWTGTPWSVLERLLMLESHLGRTRDPRRPKGPRLIDLDLLLFGTEIVQSLRLSVPHPALGDRRFALEPLLELAPGLLDPRTGVPWALRMASVGGQGVDRHDRTW